MPASYNMPSKVDQPPARSPSPPATGTPNLTEGDTQQQQPSHGTDKTYKYSQADTLTATGLLRDMRQTGPTEHGLWTLEDLKKERTRAYTAATGPDSLHEEDIRMDNTIQSLMTFYGLDTE